MRLPGGTRALLRGLWWRAGLSSMTFVVALVAAAAATTGPVFLGAARTSILRDELANASTIEQGLEVSAQGPVVGLANQLTLLLDAASQGTSVDRLLPRRVLSLDSQQTIPGTSQRTVLVWRDGACEQLRLVSGRCPSAGHEVMASRELVELNRWRVGQTLPLGGRLVGTYTVPDPDSTFWFARDYFPQQRGAGPAQATVEPVDALFTARASMEDPKAGYSGTGVLDLLVDPASLQSATSARCETPRTSSANGW